MTDNVTMTAIDGTDALAFVIIRPGSTEGGVEIEAGANGMDKAQAAYVLRHVADQFDADTPSGESSVDPKAVLAVLADLVERWERSADRVEAAADRVGEGVLAATRDARGRTYRRVARDLREVLATGRIPHDLMTDAELGG